MKKISLILILLLIFLGILGLGQPASAQNNEYTVLTPLPGVGDTTGKTTLQEYIPAIFKLAIGLSAVAAVLMIVIGGFQYISSDAIQGKKDGKGRIVNAIYGLVLVIAAWLILNEINPNLLEFNLNIEPVSTTQAPVPIGTVSTAGKAMTEDEIMASAAVRVNLELAKIYTYADPCTKGQTTGCVNLNGLTDVATKSLISLKKACGETCSMVITGGTEAGHSATGGHGAGNSVDLRFNNNLDSFIQKNGGTPVQTDLGPLYTATINGRTTTFLKESNPPHWHVTTK